MSAEPGAPSPPAGHRVGFVFVRKVGAPRFEAFFNQIMVGLDQVLAQSSSSLVVRAVEEEADEVAVYRQWAEAGLVDAVVIKNLHADDERLRLLPEIGLAFVALTDVTHDGPFSAVRIDNGQAMQDSVAFLVERGHRHIGRVAGPTSLIHTRRRTEVFWEQVTAAGVSASVRHGDYSAASGEHATRALLRSTRPPSAIIYDNDLMALGGLAAAAALDLGVPDQVSLLAWDDSVACQLATPALSALSHDVHEMGCQLGRVLIQLLTEGGPVSALASGLVAVERATTAPAASAQPTSDPVKEPA